MFRFFLNKYKIVQILLGFGFFLPGTTLAAGISPAEVFIENIGAASSVETQIQISRSEAESSQEFNVIISGVASPYITLPNGVLVTMDAGLQRLDVPIIINTGSLGSGMYEATISVTPNTSASTTVGAGSTILAGAEGRIKFSVTNEAIELYSIEAVELGDTEEGQSPGFSFILRNEGNVDTRPEKITVTFTDELDPSNTYTETISGNQIQLAPAFGSTSIDIQTHGMLSTGLYAVVIEFFDKKNKLIYTSDTNRLQVFPQGTLDQMGALQSFSTDKTEYASGELVAFEAIFENTGTIGTNAGLVIEIFKDGARIEVLKPETVFVPVNKTALIEETYRPTEGGTYTANSYVSYSVFKSNEIQTGFTVEQLNTWMIIVFLVGLSLFLGLLIILIHRRVQKKNSFFHSNRKNRGIQPKQQHQHQRQQPHHKSKVKSQHKSTKSKAKR